jgi:isopenicillin-N epimerase
LCVGRAIRFLDDLGRQSDATQNEPGMETLMRRNHRLAVTARQLLCNALRIELPCPEEMIGAMGAIPIAEDSDPGAISPETATSPETTTSPVQRLQEALLDRFAVEAPLYYWPAQPCRLLRVCAAPYNRMEEYARLADALAVLLNASLRSDTAPS